MVQVSTSVTFDESFVIPSGIKLQSFVTLTIQSSIHVYGKLDYARRSVHEGMLVAEMKYSSIYTGCAQEAIGVIFE
ncbi:hypothetical protein ACL02P_01570 [Paenibacillus sp. MB22_1]|uniref:hypothetical protein n=1 Tax=Paenibacillus sp. MB22_1 TaxID=3383121 RepID=UPI00399FFB53